MTYTLTASLGIGIDRREKVLSFEAEDDVEATCWGAFLVLGEAIADSLWARGRIVLSCGDRVVETMAAKGLA